MTVNELKKWGLEQLKVLTERAQPISQETAQIEVAVLLQEALGGITKEQLITRDVEVTQEQIAQFKSYVERRKKSEPIAYILGKKDFYNHTLIVNESVLIPRPETEQLVDIALKYFDENTRDFYVADICTGSGAIILSIADELKNRFGEQYLSYGGFDAVDISDNALNVARENAAALDLTSHVNLYKSDLCSEIKVPNNRTLILFVANPPYIMEGAPLPADVEQFEPHIALRAGADGFLIIRRLLHELMPHLNCRTSGASRTGGASCNSSAKLAMEIGEEQENGVREILRACGMSDENFRFMRDYSGKVRFVIIG